MGALTDPADLERTIRRIESESARLARLATDLLLLARLDASGPAAPGPAAPGSAAPGPGGVAALDLAPMDLRTLAADARIDVRALDPDRQVLVTGPDGGEPGAAPVLGDEARLRQVTANLVGNAVIHTPAGTPLRIGVGTAGGTAVWEIEDAGPGLHPHEAERVFDPFYRVDASRSRSGGAGAGLGLAIVRALVTAHHGRVLVRSTPGEGLTMRVELPLLAEPPPAAERDPRHGRWPPRAGRGRLDP
jgi:two-component system OmpR family sensor kinase